MSDIDQPKDVDVDTIEPTPPPTTSLSLHLTVEVGNLNAGVKASARVLASETNGLQYPVVSCRGVTARDAALEALRQIDAAVAAFRAAVESDATWA